MHHEHRVRTADCIPSVRRAEVVAMLALVAVVALLLAIAAGADTSGAVIR
jgi:hypothetical protein